MDSPTTLPHPRLPISESIGGQKPIFLNYLGIFIPWGSHVHNKEFVQEGGGLKGTGVGGGRKLET